MIECKTVPYRDYNEDKIVIKDNIYMVLDGATGLYAKNYMNDFSDASWLVDYIEKNIEKSDSSDIMNILNHISKKGYQEYIKKSQSDLRSIPTCGMAFTLLLEDTIELYTIGDCEITYITKDNEINRLIDKRLVDIDNNSLYYITKYAKEKKITVKKAVLECWNILIEARKLANKKDGYNVYSISSDPEFKFLHKSVVKSDVSSIYIYSDGFSQYFNTLHLDEYRNFFENNPDIEKTIQKIIKTWNSDPDLNKYPRFKKQDDISVIKINF